MLKITTLFVVAILYTSNLYAQQPPNCAVGGFVISPNETIWVCKGLGLSPVQLQTGSGGVPSGLITLVTSGACASGWSEVTELNGVTLVGTLAANGNVGATGGNDNITPSGTNSALTFTGTPFSSVINHTHPIVDPGHTHNQGLRNSGTAGTVGIQGASTVNNATITNGVPSNTTGITTSNPAGGVASITPAGTINTPTFTGNQFDNRSSFLRVIFCRKD